jgi:flavin reductase (DIM6/NTAB) family NADH-FMN oxidoreductase RutF
MTIKVKRSLGATPLLYPQPTLLVATYDSNDKPNFMTVAWGGICSLDPPSLMIAIRPSRWTHDALLNRKAFTICVPSEKIVAETDFGGIVSGRKFDKFSACGLTAVKGEKVDAPYIAECPVILECALAKEFIQGTSKIIIGEIMDVKADEDCLDETGKFPDIEKILPIIFDYGTRNYYGIGKKIAKAWNIGKPFASSKK